ADTNVARRSGVARLVWLAVIVAALVFAVQGGEYSTLDLVRQRRDRQHMTASIDSLTRVVDSLRKYYDRLQRDPKLQERIAREDFGMVRGTKELLYRFAAPRDSSRDSTSKRPR
ncbi:MAG TPA: septum formation initiator family protein, partial [Gemmatimonadaceae bacterium]|nr:septum formation initiator family protein [Gemmatimonadaceae bacterium]